MTPVFRLLSWPARPWLAALLLGGAAALAQAQAPSPSAPGDDDPPARAAALTYRQGGVVLAPPGSDEWTEVPPNRPVAQGDRLWTDRGARAELHLGTAVLHVDAQSHLGVSALDTATAQFSLMQGAVALRVRELLDDENVEIDTPNLAVRARQPGDYRIDVDALRKQTRVAVLRGLAAVYGDNGQAVYLSAGQQATFSGRGLAQVPAPAVWSDELSAWAAARNGAEDQSPTARYVPRGVVGYPQLDAHGSWSQDAAYGAVWTPNGVAADWAPYRYGRWEWLEPWGWTWVDDAPWGFAPFHYGRWAIIGSRWAWVPGPLEARPVYASALVVFLGGAGGSSVSLTAGGGPDLAWYPLAPGEAWWPWYRASPAYLQGVNRRIDLNRYPRDYPSHVYRQRPQAFTAVRRDDFRPGRPVRDAWRPAPPAAFGPAPGGWVPPRPERGDRDRLPPAPRLAATPPAPVLPAVRPGERPGAAQPSWGPGREGWQRAPRDPRETREITPTPRAPRTETGRELPTIQPVLPGVSAVPNYPPPPARGSDATRDQARALREQQRLQWEAERAARQQMQRPQQQPAMPGMQPPPPQQATPIGQRREPGATSVREAPAERDGRDGRQDGRDGRGERGERGDREGRGEGRR